MKKSLLLFSAITFGATLVFSQTVVNNGKQAEKTGELLELKSRTFHQVKSATPEAPIWSEDFSGGIPSSWTNAGYDDQGNTLDSALWEYRGTATFPDNTVGSRGLWNFGRGPIQSPTLNNGFVIFDSDYLDNAGISGNQGNGIAPSPHLGTLTSGTINLSGHPNVELKFNSYHRYFEGRALVAFSIDGGITWGDTLACHSTLAVNWQTDDDAVVELNVSDIIGNESNVKIRFIFDGTYDDPGANGSGSGYYFWMIDDVEMNDLPKHNLRFTGWGAPQLRMPFLALQISQAKWATWH